MAMELKEGRVSIHGTAARLGVSPRTLQRRLQSNGLNYRNLVELVRRKYAFLLLRRTSLTITEIAMELGYSEHANFARAFRRWTGHSPKLYRQQIQAVARGASRPITNGVASASQATA
ncbi:helix-turn-helix transcriptional regulator [Methyloceanibacter stevinii]|uniref:helix-turn-helix transcriptional regulator n=1 Tax=Methyloceanibacter stevinii TaxID=1774970 RepID=UPI0009F4F5F9